MEHEWLPEPEPGTHIALGFDGSDFDDWTALRAETKDGFQFTPRYGPDRLPTIWIPKNWGGRTPRDQVRHAVDEVFDRFEVSRMYCDPPRWETDIDQWAEAHGDAIVEWPTYRSKQMHAALERFMADLTEGRVTHDGCPLTWQAMENARRISASRVSETYKIAKPSPSQKIDPAMASTLAHEAAADARAAGWETDSRMTIWR